MHKPKWRAKAIHIIFAFALVFGLSAALVPTSPAAEASIPGEATFTIDSGELTLEMGGDIYGQYIGTNNGIPEGPYYAEMTLDITATFPGDGAVFTFDGEFWAKGWVSYNDVTEDDEIDFYGQSTWGAAADTVVTLTGGLLTIGPDGAITIHETGSVTTPATGESWSADYVGLIGIPELMPDLAMDVKGSVQKFVLLNVPMYVEGLPPTFANHIGLMEQTFKAMIVSDGLESALADLQGLWVPQIAHWEEGPPDVEVPGAPAEWTWRDAWKILPGVNLDATDIHVVGGGDSSIPHPLQSHPFIEVEAAAPGDAFFSVYLWWVGPEWYEDYQNKVQEEILIQLDPVEKKWGVISDSDLDVDPDVEGVQHTKLVHLELDNDTPLPEQEVITEMVYANYMWGEIGEWQEYTAGHAIVHWWLFDDTDETQDYIHALMDYLEAENDGWTAVGDYDPPTAFKASLNTNAETPFEYIDWLLTLDLDSSGDDDAADYTQWKDKVGGTPSGEVYIQTVTEDDFPGEVRGRTRAELRASDEEKVMIVTLAEYPIDYHGENPIAVQMGKKEFTVTPIVQVKTPQLRWAGEKIVLEKDWGVGGSRPKNHGGQYIAVYWLEEGSIGNLEPVGEYTGIFGLNLGAQQVNVLLDGEGVSRAILSTEQQGEADVNAALYVVRLFSISGPVKNHGFLVYFLAFEDVVLAEGVPLGLVDLAGEQICVTPLAGLRNLSPGVDGDAAEVAVQVRGWFTSDALPGTDRPPVDLDGDGNYEMAAGRYVLPNDWPALAEYNYGLRPSWDLMDEAHLDGIVADDELGPYDTAVWTTTPPNEAQWPNIGPFNTLQQWSELDRWVTTATVPADDLVAPPTFNMLRNTAVPDGRLTWLDAPMPQALVIFNIVDGIDSLSTLDKGDLEGYGYVVDDDPATFGTATGGTTTTLQDSTQSWTPGLLIGRTVVIVRAGTAYERLVTANTATSLTFAVLPSAVASGDTYYMKLYQSPFYAVEVPASPFISAGFNWDSWGMNTLTTADDGPYDYWMDLEILSVNANTPEDPINDQDVEVFSDNHGIAGVSIDPRLSAGWVSIRATAEYPYAPKKGKYGPRTSAVISANWGPEDLNPDFGAEPKSGDAPLEVTFDPTWTAGGVIPYVKAEWDFDGDGVIDLTVEDPTGVATMALVTHTYLYAGIWTVSLTITDNSGPPPLVATETEHDYIVVGGEIPQEFVTWTFPYGPEVFPRAYGSVEVDLDTLAGIPAEVLGVYWLDEIAMEWTYFVPGLDPSLYTLHSLVPGEVYLIAVGDTCTWDIPQD